jgi:hypothetical protein
MSELQLYYDNCRAGQWKAKDADQCGCRGSGWFLSEVDTFHRCNFHPPACDCDPYEGGCDEDCSAG